jgi:hypothetical protein
VICGDINSPANYNVVGNWMPYRGHGLVQRRQRARELVLEHRNHPLIGGGVFGHRVERRRPLEQIGQSR